MITKLNGVIEIDLFPEDVTQLDHPEVLKFRSLLEETAVCFHSKVTSFRINHGTVEFSLDNDELTVEILKLLQLQ
jgi:hypothetical protein